jgi:hypothetical protein
MARHQVRGTSDNLHRAIQELNLVSPGAPDAQPWWSQRLTQQIRSAGFVIGFTFQGNPNHPRSWRLDYDPGQGIHLNIGDNTMWQFTDLPHLQGAHQASAEQKVESHYINFVQLAGQSMPADILQNLREGARVAMDQRGELRAQGQPPEAYHAWSQVPANQLYALALYRLETLGIKVVP